ncbi:hva22-like protein a [Phtheirospermum japonicum]|uniref:Hva22-like protein a n=1 Tax=Phtheirospermum japonicum TaxID=374723 RepID=A0A830BHI3_9LAMI|nr:hva22-like protein a [Phtheirospermum japonicum]
MGFLILLKFALLCIDFLVWPVLALGFPLIPFWSSIKLVAIFWLVIPRFHGACYAYKSFVRPFLVVNVQEAIDSLYKLKEEQAREKERFLDVAEKYIQENGSEALEKLIATKMELKVPDNSQKDTQVIIEPYEKIVAAAPKQLKEPDAAQKDKEMLEAHEITSPEAKQVPHPRLLTTTTTTALWVPKETTYAAAKTEEAIGLENRETTSPSKKVKQEWHCPSCQINAQDTGLLTGEADQKGFGDGSKPKPEETVQKPEFWCNVCNLELLSEIDVASHLKGKRHLSNIRKMTEEEETNQ